MQDMVQAEHVLHISFEKLVKYKKTYYKYLEHV